MKIISMVPSWTETLIKCGVQVVGRTRFCIHPKELLSSIPAVGGTKNINWQKALSLGADLLILDKEENPKEMAEAAKRGGLPFLATHVRSVTDVAIECENLARALANPKLHEIALRWRAIQMPLKPRKNLEMIPGIKHWIHRPGPETNRLLYLIWKNPWMSVSKATFIGSVFENLGFGGSMIDFDQPYPEIQLDSYDPKHTLLLFSTEPFPFEKKMTEVSQIPFPSAIVNGESFSWFGIRSLEFLETSRLSR